MLVCSFSYELQTLFAESLKTVRRAPRLKCSSTKDFGSGFSDDRGGTFNLVGTFHTARTRHDSDSVSTYLDASKPNDSALRLEMPACQFVRRDNPMAFLDALHHLEVS